jgi:hypothetical protein
MYDFIAGFHAADAFGSKAQRAALRSLPTAKAWFAPRKGL